MSPSTPSPVSRSLFSAYSSFVNWFSEFLNSCGTRWLRYSFFTLLSLAFLIIYMSSSLLRRLITHRSDEVSLSGSTVDSELSGREDTLGTSVRRAPRRQRPPNLNLDYSASERRTSTSSDVQSPKSIPPRTFSGSGFEIPPHGILPSSPPAILLSPILNSPQLVESPTAERNATLRQAGMVLAPCLPLEILEMIFKCTFPRQGSYSDDTWSTILPLRQVCKQWRSIIENSPKLWPSFHPPLRATGLQRDPRVAWYMRVTDKISNKVPASDQVVLSLPAGGEIREDLFRHLLNLAIHTVSMKMVIPHRHLRELDAPISTSPLFGFLSRRKPSEGPVMEHLKEVEWSMESHHFQDQLPSVLRLPWSSLRQLPWAQLTRASLELCMTLQDCKFIFDCAGMLEEVTLRLVSGEPLPSAEPENGRHTLPHLHSLKIQTAVSISPLIILYDLPRLRHLELEIGGRDTSDLAQSAIPWQQLTHVVLTCCLEADIVDSVVTQLESIEALTLRGQLLSDDSWTVIHPLPRSLKSFVLVPTNDAAAPPMVSHFIQHVLPTSLELFDAPLSPGTFTQMTRSSHSFGSIRTLKLMNHPILSGDFLSFLALSHGLMEGSFWIKDFDKSWSPTSPSFVFPSLSPPSSPLIPTDPTTRSAMVILNLHLDFQYTSARSFLGSLKLPNLSSFTLKASRKASDCDGLYKLLERSNCPLSSLILDCPSITDAGAVKLLEILTSSLEVFEIKCGLTGSGFGQILCQQLTHDLACLCPRLERICIWPCRNASSFYAMVKSRWTFPSNCKCRLQKLRSIEAGLEDSRESCSQFAQWLKERRITSNLDVLPYSD